MPHSAQGLRSSHASQGGGCPFLPVAPQVRGSRGWLALLEVLAPSAAKRERASGGSSPQGNHLHQPRALSPSKRAEHPGALSTQASSTACPVLKGSRDQAHSLQAGRACSKQSRQRGQGGTRRPCQDTASTVPGEQGLWTGPCRPPHPSRDGQTPRCPPEDALKGSGFQNHILPPACLGRGGCGGEAAMRLSITWMCVQCVQCLDDGQHPWEPLPPPEDL